MSHVPVWDDEHSYIVEGSGIFPYDMLRRDRSFPADSEGAAKMAGDATAQKRRVTLIATRARDVVVPRWESFGWKVVAGFIDSYPMPAVCGEPFDPSRHLSD